MSDKNCQCDIPEGITEKDLGTMADLFIKPSKAKKAKPGVKKKLKRKRDKFPVGLRVDRPLPIGIKALDKKHTQKKNLSGRPTKYKPEYCQGIVKYFQKFLDTVLEEKQIGFFGEYGRGIGVNDDTIVEWAKKYPEFSAAYNACKAIQKQTLIKGGMGGSLNPAFTIFTAKNITDMRDKHETEHSGAIEFGHVTKIVTGKPANGEQTA